MKIEQAGLTTPAPLLLVSLLLLELCEDPLGEEDELGVEEGEDEVEDKGEEVEGDGLVVATLLLTAGVVEEGWVPGVVLESAGGVVVVVDGGLRALELGDPPSVMVKVGETSSEDPITVFDMSRRRGTIYASTYGQGCTNFRQGNQKVQQCPPVLR
jgi:hypothetical protein